MKSLRRAFKFTPKDLADTPKGRLTQAAIRRERRLYRSDLPTEEGLEAAARHRIFFEDRIRHQGTYTLEPQQSLVLVPVLTGVETGALGLMEGRSSGNIEGVVEVRGINEPFHVAVWHAAGRMVGGVKNWAVADLGLVKSGGGLYSIVERAPKSFFAELREMITGGGDWARLLRRLDETLARAEKQGYFIQGVCEGSSYRMRDNGDIVFAWSLTHEFDGSEAREMHTRHVAGNLDRGGFAAIQPRIVEEWRRLRE